MIFLMLIKRKKYFLIIISILFIFSSAMTLTIASGNSSDVNLLDKGYYLRTSDYLTNENLLTTEEEVEQAMKKHKQMDYDEIISRLSISDIERMGNAFDDFREAFFE